MLFPDPLAKSCISVPTTELGFFQLGGLAGGKGRSAFPFPDSILKLNMHSIFSLSKETKFAGNFLDNFNCDILK